MRHGTAVVGPLPLPRAPHERLVNQQHDKTTQPTMWHQRRRVQSCNKLQSHIVLVIILVISFSASDLHVIT